MKNNFYNIPENWYKEFNNNFNIYDKTNNNSINPKEGYLRGNLFDNLYEPYKNYKYSDLKPTNKKEELLYNILMYKFALTELDLYLDTHPKDTKLINLYYQYLNEEKNLSKEYEKLYEPLTLGSKNLETNTWNWINSPWPWEETK